MPAKKAATRNLVLYGAFAAFAAWVYSLTGDFPQPLLPDYPGSAMFPRFAVVLMGLLSVVGIGWEVLRLVRAPSEGGEARAAAVDDEEPMTLATLRGVALSALALAAFVVALEYLGMEIAIFAFCGAMTYVATRRPAMALLSGLCSVAAVYIIFVQGLSVFMPLTFLPRHITW